MRGICADQYLNQESEDIDICDIRWCIISSVNRRTVPWGLSESMGFPFCRSGPTRLSPSCRIQEMLPGEKKKWEKGCVSFQRIIIEHQPVTSSSLASWAPQKHLKELFSSIFCIQALHSGGEASELDIIFQSSVGRQSALLVEKKKKNRPSTAGTSDVFPKGEWSL